MNAYKIDLLVLDFDQVGDAGIREMIENARYPNHAISPAVMASQVADIGPWDDRNLLNHYDTRDAEFSRLFADPAASLTQAATSEPVLWYEAEESARGKELQYVIKNGMLYSTRIHHEKPATGNPVWPLYTGPVAAPAAAHPAPSDERLTNTLQAWQTYYDQVDAWKAEKKAEVDGLNGEIARLTSQAADLRTALSAQQAGVQEAPSDEKEAFEQSAKYQGAADLRPAQHMTCANGWFPATYHNPATELAWRIYANKRPALSAQQAGGQELPALTPLYIEDLLSILGNSRTCTAAGYMGSCNSVVDHRGLIAVLTEVAAKQAGKEG